MKTKLYKGEEVANVISGSDAEAHFIAAGWKLKPDKKAPKKRAAKKAAKPKG